MRPPERFTSTSFPTNRIVSPEEVPGYEHDLIIYKKVLMQVWEYKGVNGYTDYTQLSIDLWEMFNKEYLVKTNTNLIVRNVPTAFEVWLSLPKEMRKFQSAGKPIRDRILRYHKDMTEGTVETLQAELNRRIVERDRLTQELQYINIRIQQLEEDIKVAPPPPLAPQPWAPEPQNPWDPGYFDKSKP